MTARVATTGKLAPGVVLLIVHNRQFPDLATGFMVTAGDPDGFQSHHRPHPGQRRSAKALIANGRAAVGLGITSEVAQDESCRKGESDARV